MIKGGPKIINDGLVLCLDAHDAKSYAGEPTTNLAASAGYPNFSNWVAEGSAEKISAGYNFQGQPVYKCNTSVGLSYQGIWRTITGLRTAASGGSVTVSVWVKNPNSTSYNFYAYIGHDFSSTRTLEANSDWQRIEWTVLESSMANDYVEYRPYTNAAGVYIHMTMPQVEVKTYATPWVDDSRSATNGWIDRTTNNNDGTLTNMVGTGVSHYRDGQVIMPVANSYLDFDGSDQYIDLGTISSGDNLYISQGSIELWFKYSTSQNSVILGWGDGSHWGNFGVANNWTGSVSNESIVIGSYKSSTDYYAFYVTDGADYYGDGNWHHIVFTKGINNSTNIACYIDGVQKTMLVAKAGTGEFFLDNVANSEINIGRRPYSSNEYYDGQVASIKIYSDILTQAEALQNYNATKGRFL
jgi:hypothetical protein